MAANSFRRSMTCEELCSLLEDQGLDDEEDLEKIKGGKYNGRNIMLLCSDGEEMYRQKFSSAARLVLKSLLGQCDEVDAPLADQELKDTKIKEPNYSALGLGYGINVSDPDPLNHRHLKVREVLSDPPNTQEEIKRLKQSFKNEAIDMAKHKSSVTASVSDIVGKVVTFSAEAKYLRENSKEERTTGEKVTTRCISFKDNCNSEGKPSKRAGENIFVGQFCWWLIEHITGIDQQQGSGTLSSVQAVESYLRCNQDQFWAVAAKAYNFVEETKVTHYISAVDLGAAAYTTCVVKRRCRKKAGKLEAGTDFVAGLGAGYCTKSEAKQERIKEHHVGDLKSVECGKEEGVVGYELAPIFRLICDEYREVKKVLQKAVQFYLKRCCGPFAINCGNPGEKDLFWRIEDDKKSDKERIVATASKSDASIFYIEKRARPGVFNIAHYGEKVSNDAKKSPSKYLTVKCGVMSKATDREPLLQFKGKKATAFVLRHPAKNKHELCTEFWKQDSCYIKLAPHKMKKRGYIAYDRDANQIMCVGHPEDEERRRNVCMRFRLSKIGIEYAKPRAASISSECDVNQTLKRITRVESDCGDEEMKLEDEMWLSSMQEEDGKEEEEEEVEEEFQEEEETSEDSYSDDYESD